MSALQRYKKEARLLGEEITRLVAENTKLKEGTRTFEKHEDK